MSVQPPLAEQALNVGRNFDPTRAVQVELRRARPDNAGKLLCVCVCAHTLAANLMDEM